MARHSHSIYTHCVANCFYDSFQHGPHFLWSLQSATLSPAYYSITYLHDRGKWFLHKEMPQIKPPQYLFISCLNARCHTWLSTDYTAGHYGVWLAREQCEITGKYKARYRHIFNTNAVKPVPVQGVCTFPSNKHIPHVLITATNQLYVYWKRSCLFHYPELPDW